MRIQVWSCQYDPEPSGISPLVSALARELDSRRHEVEVVTAHPHYPTAAWGVRMMPYREVRDGVPLLRLPIWPGRDTAFQRIRKEISHVTPLFAALPFLGKPDVVIAVSPSFPGLSAAMAFSRTRRVPWVLWLQDLLPDGATASGVMREGALIKGARRFEAAAYRSASKIVVISDSFRSTLRERGIDPAKLVRIYNPASLAVRSEERSGDLIDTRLVLNMGNIGKTQNLAEIVRAFESNSRLADLQARLTMAGDGVEADNVRKVIQDGRVEITGMITQADRLRRYLDKAAVGLVTQSYDGVEFNVPSKLMNFMGQGLPVVAAVRPDSEVASIVREAGAGWVAADPTACAEILADVLPDAAERRRRAANALAFARENFSIERTADKFEAVLSSATAGR